MAESNPSAKLRQLTEFIMRVYAPSWFSIKSAPSLAEGAKHLWGVIEKSRYLPEELRKIVDEVIRRNAFFALPENLLIAMVSDPNAETRALGWRRIKKARAKTGKKVRIRDFVVPLIDEKAGSYVEMIDWQTCALTEPPLTKPIPDEDIENNIKTSALFEKAFEYPCHTQSVERMIRLVSEASGKVFGQDARDGYIKAKLDSRRQLPEFETKSQYVPEKK